jgi:hypothetical protein
MNGYPASLPVLSRRQARVAAPGRRAGVVAAMRPSGRRWGPGFPTGWLLIGRPQTGGSRCSSARPQGARTGCSRHRAAGLSQSGCCGRVARSGWVAAPAVVTARGRRAADQLREAPQCPRPRQPGCFRTSQARDTRWLTSEAEAVFQAAGSGTCVTSAETDPCRRASPHGVGFRHRRQPAGDLPRERPERQSLAGLVHRRKPLVPAPRCRRASLSHLGGRSLATGPGNSPQGHWSTPGDLTVSNRGVIAQDGDGRGVLISMRPGDAKQPLVGVPGPTRNSIYPYGLYRIAGPCWHCGALRSGNRLGWEEPARVALSNGQGDGRRPPACPRAGPSPIGRPPARHAGVRSVTGREVRRCERDRRTLAAKRERLRGWAAKRG